MNQSEILVSVIIPVYNNKPYIAMCLNSVIDQSHTNLEVIVVDDGSTDGVDAIIREYAKNDKRITAIFTDNHGPSHARMCGVKAAKGDYIQYLDSDDTLLPHAISSLLERALATNADIVAAPFLFCCNGKVERESDELGFDEMDGQEYLGAILANKAYGSLWANFQKRSLYQRFSLESPPIHYGEDIIWMTQFLVNNPKVVTIKTPIIHYNRVATSITQDFTKEKYSHFRAYQLWIEAFLKDRSLLNPYDESLAKMRVSTTLTGIARSYFDYLTIDMKRLMHDLKKYPHFIDMLDRRQRKMVKIYRISSFLGYWNVRRYQK